MTRVGSQRHSKKNNYEGILQLAIRNKTFNIRFHENSHVCKFRLLF